MNLEKFKTKFSAQGRPASGWKKPLRQVSLCLLIKSDKVLLALKKRGFGKDRWNGVGGKPDKNEKIVDCAVREAKEEINIDVKNLFKVASLKFYFPLEPLNKDWNQEVIVYLIDEWIGKPKETEEMKPKWFSKNKLPFDKMWADDALWLPHVLAGKRVRAEFAFDSNQNISEYSIKIY